MKIELKINYTSKEFIQVVAYPERGELIPIQAMQFDCSKRLVTFYRELSIFLENVKFAQSGFDSRKDKSYLMYTAGFVQHFNLGNSLVVLTYKWRQINIYSAGEGMNIDYDALVSLVKQVGTAAVRDLKKSPA